MSTAAPARPGRATAARLPEDREERRDKAHARAIRARSFDLLRSLLRPVSGLVWWTVVLVVGSQAAAVAGPALVAYGIDSALPALRDGHTGWPVAWASGASSLS